MHPEVARGERTTARKALLQRKEPPSSPAFSPRLMSALHFLEPATRVPLIHPI